MTSKTSLFLFLAITAILFSSPIIFENAFAADKPTKLQKECAKEKDPSKIKPECELLNLINENKPHPQSDSFFDVFFDVFTIDSFFDIFTELQRAIGDPDFDLLRNGDADFDTEVLERKQGDADTLAAANQYTDSFFDVFTEISVHNADISRIDTEIVALDLRGKSCDVGDVVTGIDADGNLVCATDQTGSGGGSSGQLIVVQRSGPTTEFSADSPFRSSFALCLSGEMVVGGGYRTSSATVNISSESMESAGGGISGWFVNAYSASGTGSITALAECATIAP